MKLVPTPQWPRHKTEWVSVLVFVFAMLILIASSFVALRLPKYVWPFFMLINAFVIYMNFTTIHEASHKNISRQFPLLEYLMGCISAFIMHGAYDMFIPIHLQHHNKVNVPSEDPDFHARGPALPWRFVLWAATVSVYFKEFFRLGLYKGQSAIRCTLPFILIGLVYALAWKYHFLIELLLLWTIPNFLGTLITIIVFDHLPHHPHIAIEKYANTRVYPLGLGDWLFMMQSYHSMHHLWPSIPWYRYRECYAQRRTELIEAGTVEAKLF